MTLQYEIRTEAKKVVKKEKEKISSAAIAALMATGLSKEDAKKALNNAIKTTKTTQK